MFYNIIARLCNSEMENSQTEDYKTTLNVPSFVAAHYMKL